MRSELQKTTWCGYSLAPITTPSRHEDEDREDQSFLEVVQQAGRLRCKAGSHFFLWGWPSGRPTHNKHMALREAHSKIGGNAHKAPQSLRPSWFPVLLHGRLFRVYRWVQGWAFLLKVEAEINRSWFAEDWSSDTKTWYWRQCMFLNSSREI